MRFYGLNFVRYELKIQICAFFRYELLLKNVSRTLFGGFVLLLVQEDVF